MSSWIVMEILVEGNEATLSTVEAFNCLNSNNTEACLAMLWLCQISLKELIRISTLPIVSWGVLEGFPFSPTQHFGNHSFIGFYRGVCLLGQVWGQPRAHQQRQKAHWQPPCICAVSLPFPEQGTEHGFLKMSPALKVPLSFMLDNRQAFSWNIISTFHCCE